MGGIAGTFRRWNDARKRENGISRSGEDIKKASCDTMSKVLQAKLKEQEASNILFETGLRIAEFCGLTTDKADMDKRMIKIDCQLHKDKNGYYLEPPKTAYVRHFYGGKGTESSSPETDHGA